MRRKLTGCYREYDFVKSFLISGFVAGTKKNPFSFGSERKECADWISFALNSRLLPNCFAVNRSQCLHMAWITLAPVLEAPSLKPGRWHGRGHPESRTPQVSVVSMIHMTTP